MNLPTAALTILFGILAAFTPIRAPALTFEQRWEPVKQLPPMVDKSSDRPLTFEERWEPVRTMPRMLLNFEEPHDIGPRIVPVRIIPIRREDAAPVATLPAVQPGAVVPTKEAPLIHPRPIPGIRTRKVASLDICQRHGMVKQITRGGRSWRCRR